MMGDMEVEMHVPALDTPPPRILVVEDEPAIARLLQLTLEADGYLATVAYTGEDGVAAALRESPQLVILDLMLPGIDGFGVLRALRDHPVTRHIPVMILSARHDTDVKVRAFAAHVDDYLTKPFDGQELLARVQTQLRHVRQRPVSPLTGLPSGTSVEQAIAQVLALPMQWAVLYVDLDNFKAYNDMYGFLRGNEMIRLLGRIAAEALHDLGRPTDFVGHIGGDDFVLITEPTSVDALCRRIITRWDAESRHLYASADLQRGGLVSLDRQGTLQTYPLVGVSVGVVTNLQRPLHTAAEASQAAATAKKHAKMHSGSSYYVDARGGFHPPFEAPESGLPSPEAGAV